MTLFTVYMLTQNMLLTKTLTQLQRIYTKELNL